MGMKASQRAIELTIRAETRDGRSTHKSKNDELGRVTVGYGHVLQHGENLNVPMSVQRALDLLLRDFKSLEGQLSDVQTIAQHQFDALICWAYHVGQGRANAAQESDWRASKLMQLIAEQQLQLACAELGNWCFRGSKLSRVSLGRRKAEQFLFTYGVLPDF